MSNNTPLLIETRDYAFDSIYYPILINKLE